MADCTRCGEDKGWCICEFDEPREEVNEEIVRYAEKRLDELRAAPSVSGEAEANNMDRLEARRAMTDALAMALDHAYCEGVAKREYSPREAATRLRARLSPAVLLLPTTEEPESDG